MFIFINSFKKTSFSLVLASTALKSYFGFWVLYFINTHIKISLFST